MSTVAKIGCESDLRLYLLRAAPLFGASSYCIGTWNPLQ